MRLMASRWLAFQNRQRKTLAPGALAETIRVMRTPLLLGAITILSLTAGTDAAPLDGKGFKKLKTEWRGDGKCLDVVNDGEKNTELALADCGNFAGQHWQIVPSKPGFWRMKTEWRGKSMCLDIVNDGKTNSQPHLAPCTDASGQRWKLTDTKGWFRLTTEWQGESKCLDIVNDGKANNRPVLASCANVTGQNWRISDKPAQY